MAKLLDLEKTATKHPILFLYLYKNMNEIYYSDYDGHYIGGARQVTPRRSMREIKSDFNRHLQTYNKSKVNR